MAQNAQLLYYSQCTSPRPMAFCSRWRVTEEAWLCRRTKRRHRWMLNLPGSSSCKHAKIVLSEDDRSGYYPQTFRIVFTSSSCKRGLSLWVKTQKLKFSCKIENWFPKVEWSSVQMHSAADFMLLSFFFFFWRGKARLRCCFGDPLTWQGQQCQRLNSYRSGWRWPLSSSLDWVRLSEQLIWPVRGSYSRYADIRTPSRPPHRHDKPGDFGLLFAFFTRRFRVAFCVFHQAT